MDERSEFFCGSMQVALGLLVAPVARVNDKFLQLSKGVTFSNAFVAALSNQVMVKIQISQLRDDGVDGKYIGAVLSQIIVGEV